MTAWIGADPGFSGALGLYLGQQNIFLEGMQLRAACPVRGLPKRVDVVWLVELLKDWSVYSPEACIERAQAMPRDGKDKIATTMMNFGLLVACFEVVGIPYHTTRSVVWKGAMGLDSNKWKSGQKFKQLFGIKPRRHDLSEAGLLAVYGSWFLEGKKWEKV